MQCFCLTGKRDGKSKRDSKISQDPSDHMVTSQWGSTGVDAEQANLVSIPQT